MLAALTVWVGAGLFGAQATHPGPILADDAKFYLDCPDTNVREGDSIDVFLVRVTSHQHDVAFGAFWHTDPGTASATDYQHQDSGAVWATDSESEANRAKRTVVTRQDNLIEGDESFTIRFSPVDNVVDRDDPARDEKCRITIIDDDPNITDLNVTSAPSRDDTYGPGETVEISATFSRNVEVDGSPALGLWVGGKWKAANYLRGSGSDTLVFGYTIQASDGDSNGISMDGGYQDADGRWHNFLNHTAVTAVGWGTVAFRAYDGLDDQDEHKVDGSLSPVEYSQRSSTQDAGRPATPVAWAPSTPGPSPQLRSGF